MVSGPEYDPIASALAAGLCIQCKSDPGKDKLCLGCASCDSSCAIPCCKCSLPASGRASSSGGSRRGSTRRKGRAVTATILFAAIVGSISAGGIPLRWDALIDPNVTGYRIDYGTELGAYSPHQSLSASTVSYTVDGLEDCAVHFLAIVATADDGSESAVPAVVAGWPSMTVDSVHRVDYPVPGKRIFFVLGSNYMDGVRVESFDEQITGEVVGSNCTSTMILLSVPVGAHGVHDLRLVNPDQTFVDFTVRLGQPLSAGRSDSLEVNP